MEIKEPLSEYYEFDFGGFCASTAEECRQILSEYHLDPVELGAEMAGEDVNEVTEEELAHDLKLLVQAKNQELTAQGMIGADCIIPQGGMVPYVSGGGIQRTFVEGPLLGIYYGLEVVKEQALFEDSPNAPSLSRPKIVHRVLIGSSQSFEIDHAFNFQQFVLPSLDDTPPEIIQVNNKPSLRNERWLKGMVKNIWDKETGVCDFSQISAVFETIAKAKYSKVPTQLNMDWFLDHLNEEIDVIGAEMDVFTPSFVVHFTDNSSAIWRDNGEETGYVSGTWCGFGLSNEFQEIEIDGEPRLEPTDRPALAIIMQAELDGQKRIIKIPTREVVGVRQAA